ncbi:50S ribosomal protein L25/general stress protein Ctc [Candidatus Thioglobus sp.]|jgi:large subunit ribosomal protein L25|uniref:50S ribosomal protein L25/general stress protein Ctc n=1 Tax=Candidatus Thioglobus sp. TaxID=2026721 RepID=UPI001D318A4F|nr:50S ribosomal protein L25/general stress protein Ctc [Candidatus Thioglobus sp.]MBT3277484.1 50S ribosomal protein L25/general stress protein Ctc [Candidatus Thioglobus sp.]MBT3447391.1 50S ribosomal protein L25/general stress protein Ctc [Candidatus Thioglobus sp.]MBT3745054.1 50S ribosomal protein L25/general stress protein Ctc [Candidatus Thioglobus sp.]MBT4000967.1 50S ribosomal protein L25/general stress protein Ctc [Candidatus Thioglobus sp.]MBT4181503.1 50S ribosomal protein L25/gene
MSLTINATKREDQGKGASRRLRRAEQIPAIIYGAGKAPSNITLGIHEITHLLENEESYTSVLDLMVGKKKEPVIIKDLQRHPAKNIVTHVDFLRVNLKQALVTNIPLHFLGADENESIRLGAILNQFVTSVEVSCLPADLPTSIDVDITNLTLGDHISLTGLDIPKGVTLTALTHGDIEAHDQSVVAVQEAKKMAEVEDDAPVAPETEVAGDEDAADTEGDE